MVFETLGKNLYKFIDANNYYGFSLHSIQKIAYQCMIALKFLHERMRITHTDLKPENILFKVDGSRKVRDPD